MVRSWAEAYSNSFTRNSENYIYSHVSAPSRKVPLQLFVSAVTVIIFLVLTLVLMWKVREPCECPISSPLTLEISIEKTMPCESNWIWYNGKCYYFSDKRETWTNSQRICLSQNASLALIDNEDELNFLNRFKGIDNHWIGIRWSITNNAWTWTDGILYNGKLFVIESVSANTDKSECVFLNHEGIKSENGIHEKKWICTRRSFVGINMVKPEVWRNG
ncbi:C-type lectin domain family 2 member B-like [Mixophyes fleayi]|uniref:C-type lectin domain family 2 member B-like n=1 Tax=Mixophyes fleayi TaxID=3061075 RepID=UPI003F4DBE9C